jgi:transposase-like protein
MSDSAMTNWEKLKKRTKLYAMQRCPSSGHDKLHEKAIGPTWSCQSCNVSFTVTNPSYLKRKPRIAVVVDDTEPNQ